MNEQRLGELPAITQLQNLFNTALPDGDVVSPDYEAVITAIITLQAQVSLGVTDQSLTSEVQTLTAFSQAKDLTSQQLALLDQSLSNPPATGSTTYGFLDFQTETTLQVNYVEEFNDEAAFQSSASQAENAMYDSLLGPGAAKLASETQSDNIEQAFFAVAGGQLNETLPTPTAKPVPIAGASGISYPLFIQSQQLDPLANNPTTAKQDGITTIPLLKAAWDKGIDAKLAAMQATEGFVAGNIVNRATQLQQSAQHGICRACLHRHHGGQCCSSSCSPPCSSPRSAGASAAAGCASARWRNIASVQLPERIRLLADSPESASRPWKSRRSTWPRRTRSARWPARSTGCTCGSWCGWRGEQALLRSSFNAMFDVRQPVRAAPPDAHRAPGRA